MLACVTLFPKDLDFYSTIGILSSMNIYLLERTDKCGYDEFDSLVVIAENAELAQKMKPKYGDGEWTTPDKIYVTLIGTAIEGSVTGVVLGSYNAG